MYINRENEKRNLKTGRLNVNREKKEKKKPTSTNMMMRNEETGKMRSATT